MKVTKARPSILGVGGPGNLSITEYIFPDNPASTNYCVFPKTLEEDVNVLFHATPVENCSAILRSGFKIPDPDGIVGLRSVSFGKRSTVALTHAMNMRSKRPGVYCIIAVRYETLKRQGLTENYEDIHDYTLAPPPEVVGYCLIPEAYKHQ